MQARGLSSASAASGVRAVTRRHVEELVTRLVCDRKYVFITVVGGNVGVRDV